MQSAAPPLKTARRRWLLRAVAVVVVIVLAGIGFLAGHWPFREQAVLEDLQKSSLTRVQARSFHGTYFPRPGCVLEQVTFQHNPKPGAAPLITVERLRIESSYPGLFTKHVRLIRAEGMVIAPPSPNSGEKFEVPERSTFVIDELNADGAVLRVASENTGSPALQFFFHNFVLRHAGGHGPADFQAKFSNSLPPGEITASGTFGPWKSEDVGKTPVSGEYQFEHASLGVFEGIRGSLSSSGKFSGVLQHINVRGQTQVPNFSVTRSSHEVALKVGFAATVNAQNGDTMLQQVTAAFRNTTISAEGTVSKDPSHNGKAAAIRISSTAGRIQDILLLFIQSARAPISGRVGLHASVLIPPVKMPFLRKVRLEGHFGVDNTIFAKQDTQHEVNRLSEGGRGKEESHRPGGKDPSFPEELDQDCTESDGKSGCPDVLSDLRGDVSVKNGIARFSNLSFSVPGALLRFEGTYGLVTEKIDLHGTLKTQAEVAKTTHGMKAFFLKVLQPFFKNKPTGYEVPVKITGTYDQPAFGLDLMAKKRNNGEGKGNVAAGRKPQ